MTDPTTSSRDPRAPLPEELEAAAHAESLREAWPRLAGLPDHRVRIVGGLLERIDAADRADDWPDVERLLAEGLAPEARAIEADADRAIFREALADGQRDREALRVARKLAQLAPTAPALTAPPFGAPLPDPVLWRDVGRAEADPAKVGTVLCRGEVAILSGPGEAGKSTVALALAHAARTGGAACGLRVEAGRVAVLSFEDSPARIAARMEWFGPAGDWEHVRIAPTPSPLWTADPEDRRASGRSEWWREWWRAVGEWGARLVVIDPASVAFAGANPSDGAAVRAFLLAVQAEAAEAGAGALIVAHDTKAARNEARAGLSPGAGAVAGSGQWHDGARAVLHLSAAGPDEKRLIEAVKANYGPSGWGARLAPRWEVERWRGLRLDPDGRPRLNRERVAETRHEWAKAGPAKGRAPQPGEVA